MHFPKPASLRILGGSVALILVGAVGAFADTAIETETAQIGEKGEVGFSQSFEFEVAKDGLGYGTLTQVAYGISDRAELLIEPFFYVGLSPDGEPSVNGVGDLEITPSYMIVKEDGWIPATLLAFKLKVPTGSKRVEGTGKFDYYPYLIFGQHYRGWTFNANFGVNFAQPVDSDVFEKTFVWDLEAEREVLPKLTLFFEGFSAEEGVKTVGTAAEYQLTKRFNTFLSYAHDEEAADVVRIGFNIDFAGHSRHHH
jgi:hypothetical protein